MLCEVLLYTFIYMTVRMSLTLFNLFAVCSVFSCAVNGLIKMLNMNSNIKIRHL